MSRPGTGRIRDFSPWLVGALAGLVDGTVLPDLVPRAVWFTMTLYAVGGAFVFGAIVLGLGLVLAPDRARRIALGLEAAGFALLFGVYQVTTSGSGFLVTPAGQRTGLVLALLLAALVGILAGRAWRPHPAPRVVRVGLGLVLAVWPVMAGLEALRDGSAEGRGLVLVSMDAARGDRISALGYPRPTTPNVDRLVESGLAYTRAVVQCPASGPSHATMLTGLPPLAHQVLSNADVLDPAVLTVAERLSAEGFSTAGFANNFYIDARYGFAQGFDTWVNEYRASAVESWQFHPLVRTTVAYQVYHRLTRAPGEKNRDALEGALHWLRHRPDGDFFLFLHLMDPHAPYDAPPGIRDRFYVPTGERVRDTPALRARLDTASDEEIAALRDLYDASIALADEKVGELVAELRRLGLFDRSLLVITGDHGEVLDENGPVFDHGFADQGNLHVPLVLGGGLAPGEPGERIGLTVATTSWVPTAFAVLGLEYREQGRQEPIGPLPLGPDAPRPVYGLTGVRELDLSYALDGALKLVLGAQGLAGCHDLEVDPLERTDLCAEEIDSATLGRLRALEEGLLRWRESTAAAGIVAARRTDDAFDPATREQLKALGYIE